MKLIWMCLSDFEIGCLVTNAIYYGYWLIVFVLEILFFVGCYLNLTMEFRKYHIINCLNTNTPLLCSTLRVWFPYLVPVCGSWWPLVVTSVGSLLYIINYIVRGYRDYGGRRRYIFTCQRYMFVDIFYTINLYLTVIPHDGKPWSNRWW